jgi:hypothetical protein
MFYQLQKGPAYVSKSTILTLNMNLFHLQAESLLVVWDEIAKSLLEHCMRGVYALEYRNKYDF